MTPNPEAGAGPFITEQKTPGGGFVVYPRFWVVPFPRATEGGDGE
jgi:hypothetical protein